jgi:hypothetical protein
MLDGVVRLMSNSVMDQLPSIKARQTPLTKILVKEEKIK